MEDVMTEPILVTGGTGTLGRHLVPLLLNAGHEVRVLSREPRHDEPAGVSMYTGDLATGEGIHEAVAGAGTIVHCAGSAKGDADKARSLVAAASGTTVHHLVYISVVGADRVPIVSALDRAAFGYYGAKRAAERMVAESGLPWTTLRATQFHDLTLMTVQQLAKLPVVPSFSGVRFQPVDSQEVASRLVELALGAPAGLVADLGGPRIYPMADLIRSYLRATGTRRPLLPITMPGQAARAMRAGANLTPERAVGRRTWEEFLAEKLGHQAAAYATSPSR
jgi:uncharacterized protein YbjT (DUF2867 family)